jgi:replication initiation and membrane attachment protein DnaB
MDVNINPFLRHDFQNLQNLKSSSAQSRHFGNHNGLHRSHIGKGYEPLNIGAVAVGFISRLLTNNFFDDVIISRYRYIFNSRSWRSKSCWFLETLANMTAFMVSIRLSKTFFKDKNGASVYQIWLMLSMVHL